jgi:hypothetical protein
VRDVWSFAGMLSGLKEDGEYGGEDIVKDGNPVKPDS